MQKHIFCEALVVKHFCGRLSVIILYTHALYVAYNE
jgi:hypothetical protein